MVGMIRALRVARRSAVKMRTQTFQQMKALVVTAPAELREQMRSLPARDVDHRDRCVDSADVASAVSERNGHTAVAAPQLEDARTPAPGSCL